MLDISETLDALDRIIEIENDSNLDCSGEESTIRQAAVYEKLIKNLQAIEKESCSSPSEGEDDKEDEEEVEEEKGKEQEEKCGLNGAFIRTTMTYNNKQAKTNKNKVTASGSSNIITVREAFGKNSNTTSLVSKLPPRLASLMTVRVETEKLLPATQDDEANEEIMNGSSLTAITLTRPALIAAQLYAQLLTMPGAWGSGLVEMEALGALAALFRRWRVECCGRESGTEKEQNNSVSNKSSKVNSNKNMNKHKKKQKRKLAKTASKPAHTKRTRQRVSTIVEEDEEDFEEEDSESESNEDLQWKDSDFQHIEETSGSVHDDKDSSVSPGTLIHLGLLAAQNASQVPQQKEFMNWSSEAREALIDTVTSLYGTVAALLGASKSLQAPLPINGQDNLLQLQESIIHQTVHSVKTCILMQDKENQRNLLVESLTINDSLAKRHETAVFLFRGLLPVLTMKDTLPNGERGKQAAFTAAVRLLERLVKAVSDEMMDDANHITNNLKTPARNHSRRTPAKSGSISSRSIQSLQCSDATTSSATRKNRKSLGGRTVSMCEGTPPVLKSSTKTPKKFSTCKASRRSTLSTNTIQPRPILRAALGLLQKLATTKGLERAEPRACIVDALLSCLRHLPLFETKFFLRFLIRCCSSKMSLHRLVGTEIIGTILSEGWLWKDHSKPQLSILPFENRFRVTGGENTTPESQFHRSLSPLIENSEEDIPLNLFETLTGRLLDKVPTVRTRAAVLLSGIFKGFASNTYNESREKPEGVNELQYGSSSETALNDGFKRCISLHGETLILTLRKRAAVDEKSTVRKSSIEALAQLLLLGRRRQEPNCPLSLSETEVSVFSHLVKDSSMQTRKAAAQALTLLLEEYGWDDSSSRIQETLGKAWATCVLPLVLDAENSCVSKAVEFVFDVLIEPILDEQFDQQKKRTAWMVMGCIGENSGLQGSTRSEIASIRTAIKKLSESDLLQQTDLHAVLLNEISTVATATLIQPLDDYFDPYIEAQRTAVWCLFEALIGNDMSRDIKAFRRKLNRSGIDLDFLKICWEKMLELSETSTLSNRSLTMLRASMRSCLHSIAKLAPFLEGSKESDSSTSLRQKLLQFLIPSELIGSAVSALAAISVSSESDVVLIWKQCSEWINEIYDSCEDTISNYASRVASNEISENDKNEEKILHRALFTVGELSVVGFSAEEDHGVTSKNLKPPSNKQISKHENSSSVLTGLNVQPKKRLAELVLALLPHNLPGLECIRTPSAVRAHAYVSIGKICLRDISLAKNCLTILARELHENIENGSNPKVQSNALLVLGDLCVRYTSMVDRYLPVMALCLQTGNSNIDETIIFHDESAIVRKHAVLLLSSLLLQDYIKWRGLLFYRFLVASADKDESVASLAEQALCGPLLTKQPKLFFNQFVESFFVLNRCVAHPMYSAAAASGETGDSGPATVGFKAIRLTGSAGRAQRHKIYQMMISKMTDEEKIGVTARLAKEVLASATDSLTDLYRVCTNPLATGKSSDSGKKSSVPTDSISDSYESAFNVLSDAFAVLSSPALRVVGKTSSSPSSSQDLDESTIEDPSSNASKRAVIASAKGKLLSRISRKHLIEIVLPILCNLKVILQSSCSPLLKDLMVYLVEIFRGYKDEVKDFLLSKNDESLIQEIEYDERKLRRVATSANNEAQEEQDGSRIIIQGETVVQ